MHKLPFWFMRIPVLPHTSAHLKYILNFFLFQNSISLLQLFAVDVAAISTAVIIYCTADTLKHMIKYFSIKEWQYKEIYS